MTDEQEKHLLTIKQEFDILVDRKYRKGQKEHGGNLIDNSTEHLLNCAIEEALDQIVYLLTIRQKLEATAKVQEKMKTGDWSYGERDIPFGLPSKKLK